jgi:hypothetical protein
MKDVIKERTSFWLDRNMPTILGKFNLSTDSSGNPFRDLPFIPGEVPFAKDTIPENALHY